MKTEIKLNSTATTLIDKAEGDIHRLFQEDPQRFNAGARVLAYPHPRRDYIWWEMVFTLRKKQSQIAITCIEGTRVQASPYVIGKKKFPDAVEQFRVVYEETKQPGFIGFLREGLRDLAHDWPSKKIPMDIYFAEVY